MAEASKKLAAAVGYTGAGTIEYLVEPEGAFWFLEMNTRIQVEHTVTEEVFGLDLVREQLLVSSGCHLSFADQPEPRGHAIQMRINAEDPGRDFAPAPGMVERFVAPSGPGVRVDSAIRSGDAISDRYDSLIAKLVVWGRDRESAIARSQRALGELIVEGVPTTAELHARILDSAAFAQGDLSTAFLSEQSSVIPAPAPSATEAAEDVSAWSIRVLEVNGRRFQVRLPAGFDTGSDSPTRPRKSRARHRHAAHTGDGPSFSSPFQGSVLRIERPAGSSVEVGETIMVIEAMKMENEIAAHRSGTLVAISPALGSSVRIGDPLFSIE
jgi:acetyl-CoA/propionyl-CoA carboxylase biotin carboxyl carrier protein